MHQEWLDRGAYLNSKSGLTPRGLAVVPTTVSSLQQIIEKAPFNPHLTSWFGLISFDFSLSIAHLQFLRKKKFQRKSSQKLSGIPYKHKIDSNTHLSTLQTPLDPS